MYKLTHSLRPFIILALMILAFNPSLRANETEQDNITFNVPNGVDVSADKIRDLLDSADNLTVQLRDGGWAKHITLPVDNLETGKTLTINRQATWGTALHVGVIRYSLPKGNTTLTYNNGQWQWSANSVAFLASRGKDVTAQLLSAYFNVFNHVTLHLKNGAWAKHVYLPENGIKDGQTFTINRKATWGTTLHVGVIRYNLPKGVTTLTYSNGRWQWRADAVTFSPTNGEDVTAQLLSAYFEVFDHVTLHLKNGAWAKHIYLPAGYLFEEGQTLTINRQASWNTRLHLRSDSEILAHGNTQLVVRGGRWLGNIALVSGINVGEVKGNTAEFDAYAGFYVRLKSAPSADVTLPIVSSDESEGVTVQTELVFTPENWRSEQPVQVVGRNKNVHNGKQDYLIELGTVYSADPFYNGTDPADVPMKGRVLSLAPPAPASLNLIAGLESSIQTHVTYTVHGGTPLTYTLEQSPSGMTINKYDRIVWTPPATAQGKSYPVTVKVSNGNLESSVSFTVTVAATSPIASSVSGNTLTITEPGNLQGMTLTAQDSSVDIDTLQFEKVAAAGAPEIPSYVTRISDFFRMKKGYSGKTTLRLPLSAVPPGTDWNHVKYYGFGETSAEDIDGKIWFSIGGRHLSNDEYGNVIIEVNLAGFGEDLKFIGIVKSEYLDTSADSATAPHAVASSVKARVICTPTSFADKSYVWANYNKQHCTAANNSDINITVINFGTTATATRWQGTTIEQLVGWLLDAQQGFDTMGLDYDNHFKVEVEDMPGPRYLGYVSTIGDENRDVLHLTSSNKAPHIIQGTSIHEYFHQAQARSKIAGRDLLIDGGPEKKWFTEGSARWFEDDVLSPANLTYDNLNTYVAKEAASGSAILLAGLNTVAGRGISRPYQRFSFFKLLSSECDDFKDVFKSLLNIDRATDPSGITNLNTQLVNAACDFSDHFDNHLGTDNSATLAAALLYYQYATQYQNQISLLDGNEVDNTFSFKPVATILNKSQWLDVAGVKTIDIKKISSRSPNIDISNIPAYGAVSIKVDADLWDSIKDTSGQQIANTEALLKISLKNGSPPLTVSLLSEAADFTGNSTLDNIPHLYYTTADKPEHTFTDNQLTPLFITFLNPNSTAVELADVRFEIKAAEASQYTKLNAAGADLPDSATSWQCVRDNNTGSVWEVKTEDGGIHDKDATSIFVDAWDTLVGGSNSESLCGFNDWRVPEFRELQGLLEGTSSTAVINSHYFPFTAAGEYWSASISLIGDRAGVSVVLFTESGNSTAFRGFNEALHARLVRSDKELGRYTKLGTNGEDLPDSAAGWQCVRDNDTGLVWEVKTTDGGIHDSNNTYTWGYSNSLVDGSNTQQLCGAGNWRIPSIDELESLVDFRYFNPVVNSDYFSHTTKDLYWSNTIDFESTQWGYRRFAMTFNSGIRIKLYRTAQLRVHLVHSAQ